MLIGPTGLLYCAVTTIARMQILRGHGRNRVLLDNINHLMISSHLSDARGEAGPVHEILAGI